MAKKTATLRSRQIAIKSATVESLDGVAAKKVPQPETLAVPVALLLAAESIAAKADKNKAYIQGVLVHQLEAGAGRIVGTDGFRLFVGSFGVPSKPPSWLKEGIMLPRDDLKSRIAMISKVGDSNVVALTHTKGDTKVFLSDPERTMIFSLTGAPVDTFPSYSGVFRSASFSDMDEDGEKKAKREWEPVGFNSRHLKHCGELAKILEAGMAKEARAKNGMVIRVFDHGEPGAPRIFDFLGYPGAVLVITETVVTQTVLPLATATILAPAVKPTVAALRAHETRNRVWAAAATDEATRSGFVTKADQFAARIAAIMARAPDLPALAGPKAEAVATDEPAVDGADAKPAKPEEAAEPGEEPQAEAEKERMKKMLEGMAAEIERTQELAKAKAADLPLPPATRAEKAAATRRRRAKAETMAAAAE